MSLVIFHSASQSGPLPESASPRSAHVRQQAPAGRPGGHQCPPKETLMRSDAVICRGRKVANGATFLARYPDWNPRDPCANMPEAMGGWRYGGPSGSLLSGYCKEGCLCRRVAMTTLFDSYNNARIPLSLSSPPPKSYFVTRTHDIHIPDTHLVVSAGRLGNCIGFHGRKC